jgi:cofilin
MASGVEGKLLNTFRNLISSISLNFWAYFLIAFFAIFSSFFFFAPTQQQQKKLPVNDNCKIVFEEIKKDKKHRYVIFNIREEKQIDAEVIGDRDAEYDQFLEDLQKGGTGECRYGLFDFEYMHQHQGTTESSKKQKLFLLLWCPDTAKIKMKMLYASSFDALKKSLVGVQKYIQASDLSEASKESVEEKLRATDRV